MTVRSESQASGCGGRSVSHTPPHPGGSPSWRGLCLRLEGAAGLGCCWSPGGARGKEQPDPGQHLLGGRSWVRTNRRIAPGVERPGCGGMISVFSAVMFCRRDPSYTPTMTEGTPPFGRKVARGSGVGSEGETGWGRLLLAISIRMMWASRSANWSPKHFLVPAKKGK